MTHVCIDAQSNQAASCRGALPVKQMCTLDVSDGLPCLLARLLLCAIDALPGRIRMGFVTPWSIGSSPLTWHQPGDEYKGRWYTLPQLLSCAAWSIRLVSEQ